MKICNALAYLYSAKMNKKGISWAKLVGLIIAVIILFLIIAFSGKLNELKEIFAKLINGFGGF